jgi:epoxyqueuosine reductase
MNELINLLLSAGASLVGFADLQVVPAAERDDLPMGVSIAVALQASVIAGIQKGPTAAYYQEYARANALLNRLATLGAEYLNAQGFRALPSAATNVAIDWHTCSTRLPHKTVATRAGLGWIGKCALLVTERFGSALRLTSVLTDAPLPPGRPVNSSRCGICTACVQVCPVQAPAGQNWHLGLPRETFFDAHACHRWTREMERTRPGVEDAICGMCIAACPWTRRYLERQAGE